MLATGKICGYNGRCDHNWRRRQETDMRRRIGIRELKNELADVIRRIGEEQVEVALLQEMREEADGDY